MMVQIGSTSIHGTSGTGHIQISQDTLQMFGTSNKFVYKNTK